MTIKEELEVIRKSNKGLLRPVDVVEYAEDPTTSLHNNFEWDDTKAAYQYRLEQARHIIRVNVTVLKGKKDPIKVRAYVSLNADRHNGATGGYRTITSVLNSPKKRAALLDEARRDMEYFLNKYEALDELTEVCKAMKAVVVKKTKKQKRA
jgi:hypothetical protein